MSNAPPYIAPYQVRTVSVGHSWLHSSYETKVTADSVCHKLNKCAATLGIRTRYVVRVLS